MAPASSAHSVEAKAAHAAYMREYYADPERREKKRALNRKYLENPTRAQINRDKAKAHYWANREARRRYIHEYQMLRKIKAIVYLGGACIHCGYDYPNALQFHHRDPSTKLFNVTTKELSSPRKYSWDTVILPELDKCDLLCANCHFREHGILSDEDIDRLRNKVRPLG